MRGVTRQVGGVKSSILGIAGATGAILAVNKAFDGMRIAARGAVDFIKSASQEAATFETLQVQFEVLLGSAEKATKRMKELEKFAGSTPFEIVEVVKASKALQGHTEGLMATGEGLKFVGDLAAATEQPFDAMATTVGRMYAALAAGRNVDLELANRLSDVGMLTKNGRQAFIEYNEAARKGQTQTKSYAEVMAFFAENIRDVDGMMDKMANTTAGKQSMVADAMSQIKVAFGKGFNEGLKDALDATTEFIPQFKDKMTEAGDVIGTAISEAVQGNFSMFEAMGKMIIDSIGLGMTQSLRILQRNFYAGLEEINPLRKIPFSRHKDAQRGSEIVEQHRVRELEESRLRIRQQMNALRNMNYMAGDQTFQSGGQTWRYQSPTATTQSPFVDAQGKRIVQVLERIDSKMTPDFAN
ncbi:MAG: hypothetical protein L7S67_06725 [Flavobacteriales bacterium]|nr:hypothetical protein [Flavobacteriales bacterium]